MNEVLLLAAARTPIGSLGGALSEVAAVQLGATCIRAALLKAEVPADQVCSVIMGQVLSAGTGQAPARQAALAAGLPTGTAALTLNKVYGDQIEQLGSGYFHALGRADDTMNLGGIKVSSAEIEQVLNTVEGVRETAAVACPPPGGGPSRLHVFVVPADPDWNTFPERAEDLMGRLQAVLGKRLNPLFRIAGTTLCASLPRTSSNKIMRRVLRTQLEASGS